MLLNLLCLNSIVASRQPFHKGPWLVPIHGLGLDDRSRPASPWTGHNPRLPRGDYSYVELHGGKGPGYRSLRPSCGVLYHLARVEYGQALGKRVQLFLVFFISHEVPSGTTVTVSWSWAISIPRNWLVMDALSFPQRSKSPAQAQSCRCVREMGGHPTFSTLLKIGDGNAMKNPRGNQVSSLKITWKIMSASTHHDHFETQRDRLGGSLSATTGNPAKLEKRTGSHANP